MILVPSEHDGGTVRETVHEMPGRRLWRPWLAAVVVSIGIVAAYWQSLRSPFLFDDIGAVVVNPTIRHLDSPAVLNPPSDGSTTSGRPVINLSFALNFAVGGLRVQGYHAVNVAIHVCAALVLMGIMRRTLAGPRLRGEFGGVASELAAAVAAWWALHPLQTETVVCIAQRTESLCSLFYLLTLYGFIRGAEPGRGAWWWQAISVGACAAGMGAKEVMVTAPVMVWLYDRTFVAGTFAGAWRERRIYHGLLASTWLVLAWLLVLGGGARGEAAGFGLGMPWWTYALKQCEAIVLYLKLSVWPHPLVVDYGTEVARSVGEVWWQAIVLVALLAGVIWALRRKPALGFAGAAFFLILSPSSSVVPLVTQTVAEHRMYLPLAAVMTVVTAGLFRCIQRWIWPGAVIAVALAGLTLARNHVYRTPLSLWEDTIRHVPKNPRAHNDLALELTVMPGRLPEAVAHFEEALRLKPDYADVHNNLAVTLAKIPGRESDALRHYQQALRLRPDFATAHANLAELLAGMAGRTTEAIRHYELALRLEPELVEAHINLANELAKIPGRVPEALAHYEQALRINPGLTNAHVNLANELAKLPGRLPEALAHYAEALRLQPDLAEAHFGLAYELAKLPGRTAEAVAHYERVLQVKPDHVDAHNNLANELMKLPGRGPEALAHYERVLQLQPTYGEARLNYARALEQIPGREAEAVAQYEQALQRKPGIAEAHNNLANLLARLPGRERDAAAHYEQALQLQPDFALAHSNLATLLARLPGRQPEALAHYETALRLAPDLADAHFNFANELVKIPERAAEAETHYTLALRLRPDFAAAHHNLGLLLAERGRTAEGAQHLEAALRLDPGDEAARELLDKIRAPVRP